MSGILAYTTFRKSTNRFKITDLGASAGAVTFSFSGIVAFNTYTGGTISGHVSVGGTPTFSDRPIVKFEHLVNNIPTEVYYLNHSATPHDYSEVLGFDYTIAGVENGSDWLLTIDNQVYRMLVGNASGNPVNGYLTQWVTVSYHTGYAPALGGGTRGYVWSGFMDNVLMNKAEK